MSGSKRASEPSHTTGTIFCLQCSYRPCSPQWELCRSNIHALPNSWIAPAHIIYYCPRVSSVSQTVSSSKSKFSGCANNCVYACAYLVIVIFTPNNASRLLALSSRGCVNAHAQQLIGEPGIEQAKQARLRCILQAKSSVGTCAKCTATLLATNATQ